jgi:geranylgeranyl diphosphate synthase type II
MIALFHECQIDQAAQAAKEQYMKLAYSHLQQIQVPEENKLALQELAEYLIVREI